MNVLQLNQEKRKFMLLLEQRSNFFSLLIPPPATALLEKFSLAWLAFFLIFPFEVTPIRTLTWEAYLSMLSWRFPFIFVPKLKAVIKELIPSEVTALNKFKTNKENMASGQLSSPTYHYRILPDFIFFCGIAYIKITTAKSKKIIKQKFGKTTQNTVLVALELPCHRTSKASAICWK